MSNRIMAKVLADISALPVGKQPEALHTLIGVKLKTMPAESLHGMRSEILAEFSDEMPIVRSILLLIDGQLELRRFSREDWR